MNSRAFTIVELLVVIVVIAILAATSVVAYNGIRTRAENNRSITLMSDYLKAIKLFKIDQGYLPESNPTTHVYRCLGENYTPNCGGQNSTAGCGFGGISNSTAFNNLLREYMSNTSSLPLVTNRTFQCPETEVKGAMYVYRGGLNYADVYYFLEGDADCGRPSGENPGKVFYSTGISRCWIRLQNA